MFKKLNSLSFTFQYGVSVASGNFLRFTASHLVWHFQFSDNAVWLIGSSQGCFTVTVFTRLDIVSHNHFFFYTRHRRHQFKPSITCQAGTGISPAHMRCVALDISSVWAKISEAKVILCAALYLQCWLTMLRVVVSLDIYLSTIYITVKFYKVIHSSKQFFILFSWRQSLWGICYEMPILK